MKKIISFIYLLTFILISQTLVVHANEIEDEKRMLMYKEFSIASGVPWYEIAAIDQYERNIIKFRESCPAEYETISICFEDDVWSGPENPTHYDSNLATINLFAGIGKDGNNDGVADINNEEDVLYTMVEYLRAFNNFEMALTSYYNNEVGEKIIKEISQLFQTFETISLSERSFPLSLKHNYSVVNNYGLGRSYGGVRSHEGIDIFADYSVPVLSTAYGVIEIVGWNDLGGYRIGIRDIYNTYQYYAHLHGFEGNLKEGDIVKPGQVIGYVGSTGYGKEGTSGKFPPHLHFGLYKYDGRREWSFSPYPHLIKWEKIKK